MRTTAYCNSSICRAYQSFKLVPETMYGSDLMYRCEACNEVRTYDYVHTMAKNTLEYKLIRIHSLKQEIEDLK